MKKFLAIFLMFFVFAIGLPVLSVNAYASSGKKYSKLNHDKRYKKSKKQKFNRSYNRREVRRSDYGYNDNYGSYRRPSVYRRHRNVINIGIGSAAGAIVGGIIGGRRGALIGAGVGAGAGAAYTYGINPKNKRRSAGRYRRYR